MNGIHHSKQTYFQETVVNGTPVENVYLVADTQNGNTAIKGNVNNRPISILLVNRPRTRTQKKVRFQNNQPVSITLDRMPNLFEPVVVYRKPAKSKKRRTHKRKRSLKRI
jgi:hypothetical protein